MEYSNNETWTWGKVVINNEDVKWWMKPRMQKKWNKERMCRKYDEISLESLHIDLHKKNST